MAIIIFALLTSWVGALAFANSHQTFYVGVTFCGDTVAEAKQLLDRVKGYTNLFVVQSGTLQSNFLYNASELEDVCDYAVNAGLDIIVYFASYETQRNATAAFINIAQERWGSHFLGVYYGDEPGGKMLDSQALDLGNLTRALTYVSKTDYVNDTCSVTTIFYNTGEIMVSATNELQVPIGYYHYVNTITDYYLNGTIKYRISNQIMNFTKPEMNFTETVFVYFPDGTVRDENGTLVTNQGNITKFEPYQQLWDSRPLQTYSKAATAYVDAQQATLSYIRNESRNQSVSVFTSDYALYWWDYQGGYDVVLAQLGWNNTVAQEIGLVRGAANLQGKSWGTILTWKYTEAPYLASGDEIYNQMLASYECGAKYVMFFNYAENMTEPYGILQDEHFDALKRFWNDVVQNPLVLHGGTHAVAALVLPSNYGWGMRHPDDNIWGIWCPNGTSAQIWAQLQHDLKAYGSRLDIVYDDPAYPATGKYSQIIYWNQTG